MYHGVVLQKATCTDSSIESRSPRAICGLIGLTAQRRIDNPERNFGRLDFPIWDSMTVQLPTALLLHGFVAAQVASFHLSCSSDIDYRIRQKDT